MAKHFAHGRGVRSHHQAAAGHGLQNAGGQRIRGRQIDMHRGGPQHPAVLIQRARPQQMHTGAGLGRKRQILAAPAQGFRLAPPGFLAGTAAVALRRGPGHQHVAGGTQFQQARQTTHKLRETTCRVVQRAGKTYQFARVGKIKPAARKARHRRGRKKGRVHAAVQYPKALRQKFGILATLPFRGDHRQIRIAQRIVFPEIAHPGRGEIRRGTGPPPVEEAMALPLVVKPVRPHQVEGFGKNIPHIEAAARGRRGTDQIGRKSVFAQAQHGIARPGPAPETEHGLALGRIVAGVAERRGQAQTAHAGQPSLLAGFGQKEHRVFLLGAEAVGQQPERAGKGTV